MKLCRKCNTSKPLDHFYLSNKLPTSPCKNCVKAGAAERDTPEKKKLRAKRRWVNHKEKVQAATKRWAANNPDKARLVVRINKINRRAKVKDLQGSLRRQLISSLIATQCGRCTYCLQPFGKKFHIDHIMPIKLGGTNDITNTQLLCPVCNLKKGATHPAVFLQTHGLTLTNLLKG